MTPFPLVTLEGENLSTQAQDRLGLNMQMGRYIDNQKDAAQHLARVLNDGSTEEFLDTVRQIACARGMPAVAREVGMPQEKLYEILSFGARPDFCLVQKVLNVLGIRLTARLEEQQD